MEIYNAFELKAMMPQNIEYTAEEVIAMDIMPKLVEAAKDDNYCYTFNFRDFKHNYRVPIDDIIKTLRRFSFMIEPLYFGNYSMQAILIKWNVSDETPLSKLV
jgi:hypothetical protein